jgi:hypothetical protein
LSSVLFAIAINPFVFHCRLGKNVMTAYLSCSAVDLCLKTRLIESIRFCQGRDQNREISKSDEPLNFPVLVVDENAQRHFLMNGSEDHSPEF